MAHRKISYAMVLTQPHLRCPKSLRKENTICIISIYIYTYVFIYIYIRITISILPVTNLLPISRKRATLKNLRNWSNHLGHRSSPAGEMSKNWVKIVVGILYVENIRGKMYV